MTKPKGYGIALDIVKSWSCDEQYRFAALIAANVGYQLVPSQGVQEAENKDDILARLDRLERAVLDLNPGLNWPLST